MDERSEEADAVVLEYAGDSPTFRLAPYGRRVEAAATSAVPIFVWLVVVGCAGRMGEFGTETDAGWLIAAGVAAVFLQLTPFVLNALYAARHLATFGMRMRDLQFRLSDGSTASGARCFVRALVALLCMPLLPVSVITALVDERRRSVADLLCGTTVWWIVDP